MNINNNIEIDFDAIPIETFGILGIRQKIECIESTLTLPNFLLLLQVR